jgi:capsular polysaccharide biosynthesis protein
MPGPGWHSIHAALEAKASDEQDPDYGSDFSKLVRGYTSKQMAQTAKDIYNLLGPLNKQMARQHVEGADAVVRVWWNNGFNHVIAHGKKTYNWQADWRNRIREDGAQALVRARKRQLQV